MTQTTETGEGLTSAIHNAAALLQAACHGAATESGWWNDRKAGINIAQLISTPQTEPMAKMLAKAIVAQKLCLIHSETSEAMEGHRKDLMDDKLPHRPMVEVELADVVIRAFDLAGAMGLDLGGAIAEKMAFNAQRPDHKVENREAAGGKAY